MTQTTSERNGDIPGRRVGWIGTSLALASICVLAGCSQKSAKGPTPIPGARLAGTNRGVAPTQSPFGGIWLSGSPATATTRSISALLPDDELWIIAAAPGSSRSEEVEAPGTGMLTTRLPGEEAEIALPLKHTDVKASIRAYIATVEVTQQFHNPYDRKIEAIYVFPLPHNAAVNEFLMIIGERRIRGIIRERQEAERLYREAKSEGYVASLLTEERPNVFTQSVANIEPGKQIDVNITYFHTLAYVDGWYEFVFPMVVGPRFNPPGSANGIGAVARRHHGISGHATEVQYLKPHERSGHDISLRVDVDAGVAIEESLCRTHTVAQEKTSPERLLVALRPNDRVPNKDFVLRYRVAGEGIKSGLLTHRDERGDYFTLMLYPPRESNDLGRQALELVFVLDCSGSMSGRPLAQARAAIERALQRLQPLDTFQLIRFSNHASALGPRPLLATPQNRRRGLEYLSSLTGEGGTMMIEGVKAALDFPHDPQRLRFVCFLTDGYIGNESEILGEVRRRLGASRIFSFGVGSSVNRYLLDPLARLGRGAVAYLGPNDDAATVMDDFFQRISYPALTDLQIDWGAMQVTEVFPRRLPDLFIGRPVILTGRSNVGDATTIRVRGTAGAQPVTLEIPVRPDDATAAHRGLPSVWARMKIADLAERSIYETQNELSNEIKQVALDYGLMSAFTAFVAIDSTRRTEDTQATTVPVAVPVPDGVKYDTTVEERK